MKVGGGTGSNGTGVGSILPEQRAHRAPVAFGHRTRIVAEEMLNRVLVPAASGGGSVLDLTCPRRDEADTEGETPTPQAERWCASSCARSSWFSRRVLG